MDKRKEVITYEWSLYLHFTSTYIRVVQTVSAVQFKLKVGENLFSCVWLSLNMQDDFRIVQQNQFTL